MSFAILYCGQTVQAISPALYDLHHGDCLQVLKTLADNSVDSVVTDPPYHLTALTPGTFGHKKNGDGTDRTHQPNYARRGFMNQAWDGGDIAFRPELWAEVLRVLKPGGHLAAFSGSRTYHRMACAIEDAGFQVRDQIMYVYGTGFPKSRSMRDIGRPELGTSLKPAHEPICLARKPLSEKSIAANVLRWGTGAINVDGCRIAYEDTKNPATNPLYRVKNGYATKVGSDAGGANISIKPDGGNMTANALGRFPANLCHDGSQEVLDLFPETGNGYRKNPSTTSEAGRNTLGTFEDGHVRGERGHNDSGSAARFFFNSSDSNDLFFCRAKTILNAWNQDLASTADNVSPLSRQYVDSVLSDVVTLVSRGTLISCPELSTSATPSELRRISEASITAMLALENEPSQDLPLEKRIPNGVLVKSAATKGQTGITTITISHWKSDGSADPVIFNIMPPSLAAGAKDYAPRFMYCAKASKADRAGSRHPTVKPIKLMQWLVRLITPPTRLVCPQCARLEYGKSLKTKSCDPPLRTVRDGIQAPRQPAQGAILQQAVCERGHDVAEERLRDVRSGVSADQFGATVLREGVRLPMDGEAQEKPQAVSDDEAGLQTNLCAGSSEHERRICVRTPPDCREEARPLSDQCGSSTSYQSYQVGQSGRESSTDAEGRSRQTESSASEHAYMSPLPRTDRDEPPCPNCGSVLERIGGVVLDPFAGSGTTGAAAILEGFRPILIEREDEYVVDIRKRLAA